MTQQRVEVHPQRLRSHLAGNRLPDERTLSRIGQQVPTNLQVASDQRLRLSAVRLAVSDQTLDLRRQVGLGRRSPLLGLLLRQPTEQRTPLVVLRRWPSHPQHVAQARIVPDRSRQQLANRCLVQPPLERPLQAGRQAGAAELSRTDHLEHGAQNATVVHDPIEDSVQQLGVPLRQDDQQRRRHVLHVGPLTRVDRQLRQEDVVVDLVDQLSQLIELALGTRVVNPVEAARGCHLGQRMLRHELVRPASGLVVSVRPRQRTLATRKQCLVGHLSFLSDAVESNSTK